MRRPYSSRYIVAQSLRGGVSESTGRVHVLDVHSRATATTAAHFLDSFKERMPFPVKAIQVDGGLEFESVFEEECQRRKIRLFILPPQSPKLNGYVERAHRTHAEEFYEVTESSFDLTELRGELLKWEKIYNTVRPHQVLNYLTPLEFFQGYNQKSKKGGKCHQSTERVHGLYNFFAINYSK